MCCPSYQLLVSSDEGTAIGGRFDIAAVVKCVREDLRDGVCNGKRWNLPIEGNKMFCYYFLFLVLNIISYKSEFIRFSSWCSLSRSKHLKLVLNFSPERLDSVLQVCGIAHSRPH